MLVTPSITRDSKNKLLKKWRANYYLLDDEEVELYSLDITTNIKGHLESHYKIIVPKDLTYAEGIIEEFDNQILANSINLKVLIKALITLIVPEFHVLCQVLNHASEGLITTSHSGTSPNRHLLFTVYAYFTSYNNKNTIIADNASSNNVLYRFVKDYIWTAYNRAWDALDGEIRDVEITEQVRAKFRLLGPLGQGHNIVVYIRRSLLRTAAFKKNAGRLIPINNSNNNENTKIITRLDAAYLILNKYYITTNVSPFYAAALVLNPERSLYTTTVRPLISNEYTDYNIEELYSPTINILLILLISDESERDRGRLKAEIIKIWECLKH
ncbi:hypothetical protein V8E51_013610 [Hyaloscypha variabilis]